EDVEHAHVEQGGGRRVADEVEVGGEHAQHVRRAVVGGAVAAQEEGRAVGADHRWRHHHRARDVGGAGALDELADGLGLPGREGGSSTTVVPASAGPAAVRTAVAASPSTRLTMTTSAPATAAAGSGAASAPSATSGSARDPVRFHTTVRWPAPTSARARAEPMAPSPRTVTSVAVRSVMPGSSTRASDLGSTHFSVRTPMRSRAAVRLPEDHTLRAPAAASTALVSGGE